MLATEPKTDCNSALAFSENEQRLLRQWLARRYARAAFPDHFENHLQSTKSGPVKKLFKSAAAKLISTVYIDIDNEDAGGNENYYIHVILTALAEDLADPEKRVNRFEMQFFSRIDRLGDLFGNAFSFDFIGHGVSLLLQLLSISRQVNEVALT
jgi:hypothetical protein